MSNKIEGLILDMLPEYEFLRESDPEIADLIKEVQEKIELVQRLGHEHNPKNLAEIVLEEKNREIDIEQTYARYLVAMNEYENKPKGIKKFKLAHGRSSKYLNSPFARFKEAEKLGIEKGKKVLLETEHTTGEFIVEHMTTICLIKLEDLRNPVSPFYLTNLDK